MTDRGGRRARSVDAITRQYGFDGIGIDLNGGLASTACPTPAYLH
ncbi:MAG: hypothetical protein ABSF03_31835 [Streptosporangiaceae bacterium]|jgi:hypothetical protein